MTLNHRWAVKWISTGLIFYVTFLVFLLLDLRPNTEKEKLTEDDMGHELTEVCGPTHTPEVLGNYEPRSNPLRIGPGEEGAAVETDMDSPAVQNSMELYRLNLVASDQISLDRSLPDTRMEECKYWQYPVNLPTASVVVIFYNEGTSVLLRTIHSIINRSPRLLLKELILVDDCSDRAHLKEQLENYLLKFSKVRLLRNKNREGLIRSRTIGAKNATGDVLIFLDAHTEVNVNWLPPLLARIQCNRKTAVVPVNDYINDEHFAYQTPYSEDEHNVGLFNWGFTYAEVPLPWSQRRNRTYDSEPYSSPHHVGCMIAIDRSFFFEIGAYDQGLRIWGGENHELSFKVWMCGGRLEWVPCSRVGHVFRHYLPYSFEPFDDDIVDRNYKRVVETWMDEPIYKESFYTSIPRVKHKYVGDITELIQFKKDHKCKNFKWYMENVAWMLLDEFPLQPKNKWWGEVANRGADGYCLYKPDEEPGNMMELSLCQGDGLNQNQMFRLNVQGLLTSTQYCIDVSQNKLVFELCQGRVISGDWNYVDKTQQIYHTREGMCMQATADGSKLVMRKCTNNILQKWIIIQYKNGDF